MSANRIQSAAAQAAAQVNPCAACPVREPSFCGALDEASIRRLNAISRSVACPAGRAVIHEGDAAETVYNVVEGCVRLSKMLLDGRRQITGFLLPGDFLGLAFNDTYACTAEAVTDVRLCAFPRRRLEALFDDLPALERRLLGMAANEIVVAQDQMLLLGRKTAEEKVASFLGEMERRTGGPRADETIRLPMTRADIADYLGLTVETVSRTFTQLAKTGMIDVRRANVRVVDRAALEALANG